MSQYLAMKPSLFLSFDFKESIDIGPQRISGGAIKTWVATLLYWVGAKHIYILDCLKLLSYKSLLIETELT